MKFYHSKLLNDFSNLMSIFTTKDSGNIAFHVNDDELNVLSNHELLAKKLGYEMDSLVHMKQIHSDIVHVVNEDDNFNNPPTCDAVITDRKNTPLMVMVADCSPILFYDDKKKVIAAAHAGRQGAFKNIVKNVVDCFVKEFDSDTKDIHVSVGASIGSCCYEVGSEIDTEAKELSLEYAMHKRDGRFYLDVSSIIKKQLLDCGVKKEHIGFCGDCTCCSKDTYNSYRAEPSTGRFAGIIMLK